MFNAKNAAKKFLIKPSVVRIVVRRSSVPPNLGRQARDLPLLRAPARN